jgi:hypothetical protein
MDILSNRVIHDIKLGGFPLSTRQSSSLAVAKPASRYHQCPDLAIDDEHPKSTAYLAKGWVREGLG